MGLPDNSTNPGRYVAEPDVSPHESHWLLPCSDADRLQCHGRPTFVAPQHEQAVRITPALNDLPRPNGWTAVWTRWGHHTHSDSSRRGVDDDNPAAVDDELIVVGPSESAVVLLGYLIPHLTPVDISHGKR